MRKAADLLFKGGFVECHGKNEHGETRWRVTGASDDNMIRAVDRAMLVRLLAGLDETSSSLDTTRRRTRPRSAQDRTTARSQFGDPPLFHPVVSTGATGGGGGF